MSIQPLITSAFSSVYVNRSALVGNARGLDAASAQAVSGKNATALPKIHAADLGKPHNDDGDVVDLSHAAIQAAAEKQLDAVIQAREANEADDNAKITAETTDYTATADQVSADAEKYAQEWENQTQLAREDRQNEAVATDEQAQSDAKLNSEYTPEEQQQLDELKARDAEVKTHEAAHLAAAGGFATSGASYTYQTGPDGQKYAIGGEVSIDVGAVSGDPEATIVDFPDDDAADAVEPAIDPEATVVDFGADDDSQDAGADDDAKQKAIDDAQRREDEAMMKRREEEAEKAAREAELLDQIQRQQEEIDRAEREKAELAEKIRREEAERAAREAEDRRKREMEAEDALKREIIQKALQEQLRQQEVQRQQEAILAAQRRKPAPPVQAGVRRY